MEQLRITSSSIQDDSLTNVFLFLVFLFTFLMVVLYVLMVWVVLARAVLGSWLGGEGKEEGDLEAQHWSFLKKKSSYVHIRNI